MNTIFKGYFPSPIGTLEIQANNTHIIYLNFFEESMVDQGDENTIILECKKQLTEYFSGTRRTFDLPLSPEGTEFQKKVWNALLSVPFGQASTYKDIAAAINNPKAVRAVGGANNKNPILLIIPCHRIIGTSGKLIGYGGGLWRKEWLLDHEQIEFQK